MESKIDMAKRDKENLTEEWEKPSVKELNINAITQSGDHMSWDGGSYS
jgi:hypothetical protein